MINWQSLLLGSLGLPHMEIERSQRNPGYRILQNEKEEGNLGTLFCHLQNSSSTVV